MTTIDAGALANISHVFRPAISVRANFSITHLLSAAHFSRLVAKIERDNAGQPLGSFFDEILAYSTACVMTTVGALESYANEMYADYPMYFPNTDGRLLEKLRDFYDSKPVLEKFQFALFLRNVPTLDKGAKPYQDINVLLDLRNALVHFKPEWDTQQDRHSKIAEGLRGRFKPSPYYQGSLFPMGWATTGGTKWSVNSAVRFINHFEDQAGLDHRLTAFMDRLKPE
jgi:hypothetical protein